MKLTATQKAYLAGIIDGESYVFFNYGKDRKWRGGVVITITNKEIIEWLLKVCGGLTYSWKYGVETKNWKQRYRWEIQGDKAMELLKQIKKYLIIKKKQAELYIEFRKTFKGKKYGRGKLINKRLLEKRLALVTKIKKLNKRGGNK